MVGTDSLVPERHVLWKVEQAVNFNLIVNTFSSFSVDALEYLYKGRRRSGGNGRTDGEDEKGIPALRAFLGR